MSSPSPTLNALRAEAAATRANLITNVQHVEDQLNVPKRIRNEVSEHPLKWAALGVGAGYVALKLLPTIFRLVRKPVGAALVQPLLASAATTALPLLSDYLKSRFHPLPLQLASTRSAQLV